MQGSPQSTAAGRTPAPLPRRTQHHLRRAAHHIVAALGADAAQRVLAALVAASSDDSRIRVLVDQEVARG